MKASDLYGSPFLKGADLQKVTQVTVSEYQVAEFDDQKTGQKQQRIVLSFHKAKKQLVLNKTQANALISAYGDDPEGWIGKGVILSPGQAPNGQPTIIVSAVPANNGHEDNPFA